MRRLFTYLFMGVGLAYTYAFARVLTHALLPDDAEQGGRTYDFF